MKRIEVTAPATHEDAVKEVLGGYDEDFTVSKVEKDDRSFIQVEMAVDSGDIDPVTEELKGIKDLDTGDLTIEVLEETARIEKGKRREGGTSGISVQEMYSQAFEFSSFGLETWVLIALGAGIAVFGAISENVIVVIGSMVITPMLGPFIAASFGFVIGDRQIIRDSIFYATLSVLIAVASAFVVATVFPVRINPLILLIADAGFETIPLSLFVGAAAALTFTTESREALAGVAVAIALVPPSAVVGIALSQLNLDLLVDVSLVLVTNMASLIFAGSLTFKLLGITPSTYYRQKVSERQLKLALAISSVAILVTGGFVAWASYQDLQQTVVRTEVESFLDERFGDRVLMKQVDVSPRRASVTVAVVDPQISATRMEEVLRDRTGTTVNVKLVGVQGQGGPYG